MRLRNIPRAGEFIENHPWVIHEPKERKGHWKEAFGNDQPIRIEIGMGKGQFILNLAAKNPEINYIGIERYTSVLLRAAEKADTEEYRELTNVRFICIDAREIEDIFEKEEIDRIYLNFSDPWPKARHQNRRLTSGEFLTRYKNILQTDHTLEFKTDNTILFDFSLAQVKESGWTLLASTYDLHHDEVLNEGNVMTEYEQKFSAQGNPIHKLIARP